MTKFYFFIGTEAELIKLFPVLKEFQIRKINFKIIATGQNDIQNSYFLKQLNLVPNMILSREVSNEKPLDLIFWSLKTFFTNFNKLKKEFKYSREENIFLIVHGDTVSTAMGALFGRLLKLKVVHIESGLRSFNYFSPIPEEIDRVFTSRLTNIHFCPNEWALKNLSHLNGFKVNTQENTLFDTFNYANSIKVENALSKKLKNRKYFVLIIHRQENILRKKLIFSLLQEIFSDTKDLTCVFVLHKLTKSFLEDQGLMGKLKNKKNIILSDRMEYPKFLNLVRKSEFFITDGGSNQEESYYLGKPCLILRNRSERVEGLNNNVVLSNFDSKIISSFIKNYRNYHKKKIKTKISPSKIIVNYLSKL